MGLKKYQAISEVRKKWGYPDTSLYHRLPQQALSINPRCETAQVNSLYGGDIERI